MRGIHWIAAVIGFVLGTLFGPMLRAKLGF